MFANIFFIIELIIVMENTTNILERGRKTAFLQSAPEQVQGHTMQSMIREWTRNELWVRGEFISPMVDKVMDKQMEVCMVMDKVMNKSVDILDTSRQSLIEMVFESVQPNE